MILIVSALCLLTPAAWPCILNVEMPEMNTVHMGDGDDPGYRITAEQMPSFRGGDILDFTKWVAANVKYPPKLFKDGVHGTVVVSFVVDEKGSVGEVKTLLSPDPKLANVIVKAVKRSPRWEPGREDGVPVAVIQSMPIKFGMPSGDDKKKHNLNHDEEMPTFMGGDINGFARWVAEHIQYPSEAVAAGMEGTVVVSFIVDRDGSVDDVKIVRSPDAILAQEAVRTVRSSPKWKPGTQDGETVRVTFNLPVNFRLPATPQPNGPIIPKGFPPRRQY